MINWFKKIFSKSKTTGENAYIHAEETDTESPISEECLQYIGHSINYLNDNPSPICSYVYDLYKNPKEVIEGRALKAMISESDLMIAVSMLKNLEYIKTLEVSAPEYGSQAKKVELYFNTGDR